MRMEYMRVNSCGPKSYEGVNVVRCTGRTIYSEHKR